MAQFTSPLMSLTVGIDLGDKYSYHYNLGRTDDEFAEGRFRTTPEGLAHFLESLPPSVIAMETGAHSRWVAAAAEEAGHQVTVANARQLQLISKSDKKSDRTDAELLARLARSDLKLLSPVTHRDDVTQSDLSVIRSRAALVNARTDLINHARGLVKPFGHRLPSCDARYFHRKVEGEIPDYLAPALEPVVEQIEQLTERIRGLDRKIENLATARYPQAELLCEVYGVSWLIALTFILSIGDPSRFKRSRDVGAFLGLVPRQSESGDSSPQLRITKAGDRYLRQLLVSAAHCLLRRNAPESDLKRFGERIASRGGKNAKRRAVVAVARKLSVLLHRLWTRGEVYDPDSLAKQRRGRKVRRRNSES